MTAPSPSLATTDPLHDAPLFGALDDSLRAEIAARAVPQQIAAGDWLFRQGEQGDSLYVVLSGRLEVVFEQPEELVIRVLGRGDAAGELSLVTGGARSASVRARRDCDLLQVTREDFLRLLSDEPTFALSLTRAMGEQLQASRAIVVEAPPTPAIIAVVPLQEGLPVDQLADSLATELGSFGTVTRVRRQDVDDPAHGANATFAELLDGYERNSDQVVMVAASPNTDEHWSQFCLRQADRILTLAGPGQPPSWLARAERLQGCDIAYLGWKGGAIDTEPWDDALHPRSTHLINAGAGEAASLGRMARRLAGRSVGLVLSGGGARSFSQIGVLEELTAAGIPIDRVGGCSMGAFIGALYASGVAADGILAHCRKEMVKRNPWGDYTAPVYAGLRGERLRSMLLRTLGPGLIQELERPFYCVSSDLVHAEFFVHDRGPLAPSVFASMCLPGAAPPAPFNGRLLVDGAIFDNLPVETMAAHGEGPVIAVDVTAQFEAPQISGHQARRRRHRLGSYLRRLITGDEILRPRLQETLTRSMLLGSRDTSAAAREFADFVITPQVGSIGMMAFKEIDRTSELGRTAARSAFEDDTEAVDRLRDGLGKR